jgi:hypothetical protein
MRINDKKIPPYPGRVTAVNLGSERSVKAT